MATSPKKKPAKPAKSNKKRWPIPEIPYGPVLITKGSHAGRVGDYDDDGDNPFQGVVYFGHPLQTRGYFQIDKRYLKEPTIGDLFHRHQDIANEVMRDYKFGELDSDDYRYFCSILVEKGYIYGILEERNLRGKHGRTTKGKSIYLAHSSADKGVVRMIHDDLVTLGHNPWLDEYKIGVGE